jgi:hypothetical protein
MKRPQTKLANSSGLLSIWGFAKRLYRVTTLSQCQIEPVGPPGAQSQGETKMQFMVYDPNFDPEAATPPTPEIMVEMGQFISEAIQAGVVVTTGALQSRGTRLELANGKFTVTDGPFIELKELLAGFAVIEVDSLEEAVEWSKRFRQIVGDGVSEIVPLFGPGDFDHA